MENLGSAVLQPFQGPQGAENALKLAGMLAPRVNLGGRPLQPGEGEGLRNLLGAFGQFAEQKRRKDAEGQVLSGIQAVMAGKAPISSLPVSDLPESMQRILFEQVAQNSKRGSMSPAERSSLMNTISTIAHRGGDPMAALREMGIPLGNPSAEVEPATSAPVQTPRGAVSMRPDTELAPSMLRQAAAPAGGLSSVFGRQDASLSAQQAHSRLADIVRNSQGVLKRSDVITAISGMPADDARFQITQLEQAGLLPQDMLIRTQEAQENFPGLFPPDVSTTMKPSGPEVQFKPRTPHNLPQGTVGVITGPQGQELSRITGPPPSLPEVERLVQLLPPELQGQARKIHAGILPKAGEEKRIDETERHNKANEGAKTGKGGKLTLGEKLVNTAYNSILRLRQKDAVAGPLGGWVGGGTPAQSVEDQVEDMKANETDAVKRRAIDMAWDRYLQEQTEGGNPDDHVPATGQEQPRVKPPQQTRPPETKKVMRFDNQGNLLQ